MKVLLREDVPNLGLLGDEVVVKPGYARNYLLPKNKAFSINSANIKLVTHQRKKLDEAREKLLADYQSLAEKINAMTLEFTEKTNKEGHLFGSVNTSHILAALKEKKISINNKNALEEIHLRKIGEQVVIIKLHPLVTANLNIKIIPETPLEEIKEIAEETNNSSQEGDSTDK